MKKVVVRLDLPDDKGKRKAMKTVSTIRGIDSIAIDMKEKKMTVIGDVDPVKIAGKLRKIWHTEIVFVGPAKEPEKKEEPKKEESKNEDAKKGEGKKEEPNKKEDASKEEGEKKEEPKKQGEKKMDPNEHILELINSCEAYNPHLSTYYYVLSAEDNPNACIIS